MQDSQRETPSPTTGVGPSISDIIDDALEEHRMDAGRESGSPYERFHTQLWTFTRVLKSHFCEGAEPDDVFWEIVVPEIERRGGWEILDTCLDAEEIYLEFVCNWDAVRYRIGQTPLSNASMMAEEHPLEPRRASKRPDFLKRYARFVSIAGWLQVSMGNNPILLPVSKLADLLGVRPMTITRYRQTAIRDGYLKVVSEHVYSKGRATEFLFDVSRFNPLQRKAASGTLDSFAAGKHLL